MRRIVSTLAVLAVLASVSAATTVRTMTVEEMTRSANTVVEARALDSWSQWNPEHTVIFTYTRFQLFKTLKGAQTQQFVVRQLGGKVGNTREVVPGVRHFLSGEDALLFLRPSPNQQGTHDVVGLMQGNFRVYTTRAGEVVATNGMPGASAVQHDGSVHTFTGNSMQLQHLEARIQGALAQ